MNNQVLLLYRDIAVEVLNVLFWRLELHNPSAHQFHHNGEEADIFMVDISKTLHPTLQRSGWVNITAVKRGSMSFFLFLGELSL